MSTFDNRITHDVTPVIHIRHKPASNIMTLCGIVDYINSTYWNTLDKRWAMDLEPTCDVCILLHWVNPRWVYPGPDKLDET